MPRRSANTQMFALRSPPPARIELAGKGYRLVRVFKHDFFAATCLYEPVQPQAKDAVGKVVVKYGRTQPFCGLPMSWYGRLAARHEESIYRTLAGIRGVPRWIGSVSKSAYAIEYIDARPLDQVEQLPAGFFDRLGDLFGAVHARGVAYCDANKLSNILVGHGAKPYLVDFQISLRRRDDLPWPLRAVVRWAVDYLAARDLYHLFKHKRRLAPEELTEREKQLSRKRSGLHLLHRKLTKPWRALRRGFLRKQYLSGRLVSPTAILEDHHQPEKETWRDARHGAGKNRADRKQAAEAQGAERS